MAWASANAADFRTRTIGRPGERSSATSRSSATAMDDSVSPSAAKSCGIITASGFEGRCLRSRSRSTASLFAASQTR